MIQTFLALCCITLFTAMTAAFGYLTVTATVCGPPMLATVCMGCMTAGLAIGSIRERLK